MSKLDGEACNADGTLKDAMEIEWVNSPSDLIPLKKRPFDDEADLMKKPYVSSSCAWNSKIGG